MKNECAKHAFTMIELIFVIVIMGIVGVLALETVRQYYENIFRNQEYTQRVEDADRALEIISKYFESAIGSSIANNTFGGVCLGPPVAGDLADHVITFVAADTDALLADPLPGWSEDTQLVGNVINATDANYNAAGAIITDYFPQSALVGSAIYNKDSADVGACARFGNAGAGYHLIVAPTTATSLTLNNANIRDGRQKYLISTGYAFRVAANGDLSMDRNFRPWVGETFLNARKSNIMAQNVAHIYADYDATDFAANANLNERGLVWRLKVCMRGLDATLATVAADDQAICRERRVHVRY